MQQIMHKYAATLKEKTQVEVWFLYKVAKAALLKSHFGKGVLL